MEGVQSDCVPEKIPLTQLGCVRGIYLFRKSVGKFVGVDAHIDPLRRMGLD